MARSGGRARTARAMPAVRPASPPAASKLSGTRGTSAAAPAYPLVAVLIPVAAALVAYLPALRNGFIWDDPLVLQQLRSLHAFGDLLVPPPIIPKFYFRPIILLSYLFDRALGGEAPFWFHASVITTHALNVWLVFVLGRRLFPADWTIASGGALLFAVFPTHVESVAWMAGRSDVIVCAFILLTVLLCMDRDRAWTAWLGGLTFLLAALSKEMAVACIVLVPLLDLASTRRLYASRYLPLLLATLAYFALRANALGAVIGGIPTGLPATAIGLDLVRAIGFYVVRALVPVGLCAYIPEIPAGAGYLLLGVIALLLSFGLVVIALRGDSWPAGFLGAWFFVTLAPSLTVIVRHSASAVLADRYLYVPSVASCLLCAWAITRLARRQRIEPRWAAVGLVLLSALFAVQAAAYTRVWRDDFTFWSDVAAKVPDDALPQRELANALLDRGRLDDAEHALQRALAGKSNAEGQAMAYNNLGNLYRHQGRYDAAEQAFAAGLKVAPHPALFHNLGMTLMAKTEQEQQQGDQAAVVRDVTRAREAFEQALKLGSTSQASQVFLQGWDPAKTHSLLGQVLFSLGDRAGAREHLEAALRLEPTGPVAELTRRYMQKVQP